MRGLTVVAFAMLASMMKGFIVAPTPGSSTGMLLFHYYIVLEPHQKQES